MPLEGHWARQHTRLTRRDRLAAWIAAGALAVLVLVLALSVHGAAPPARGCVDVTIASTTGGATIHDCGAGAKRLCSRPDARAAVGNPCRRAGLD
jgi:hypothetical protein